MKLAEYDMALVLRHECGHLCAAALYHKGDVQTLNEAYKYIGEATEGFEVDYIVRGSEDIKLDCLCFVEGNPFE